MKKLHKIVITPDGWVYIEFNDGTEKGLGDIGVDVIIKTLTTEENEEEVLKFFQKRAREEGK